MEEGRGEEGRYMVDILASPSDCPKPDPFKGGK